jgi:uncharacterized protein YgbK (DUF1537 family)
MSMEKNSTSPLLLGGIGDDFTGSAELASMMVQQGVAASLVTSPAAVARAPGRAIVVAHKSRVAPADQAVATTLASARALKARGARQLFFKYCATFDSTPAGNIGPCADALMDLVGATQTAYCPAFPEVARTVYQGHLFFADRLISESSKRHDPLTPMTDPDLQRVLQAQTPHRVGLLARPVIVAGDAAVQAHVARLAAEGVRHIITDATDEADLQAIARLTVDWPLMTGGSSVANHYPALWRGRGLVEATAAAVALPAVAGHGLVLAGSCAERTLAQLEAFGATHPVLRLDLLAAAAAPERALADAVDWASTRLERGPVAIATSEGPEAVARVQATLGVAGAASLAERLLGQLARTLVDRGVRRLMIAGGETSGAAVEALGLEIFQVGAYQGAGISRMVADDPQGRRLALCLKSGKLGPIDMFATILSAMTQR